MIVGHIAQALGLLASLDTAVERDDTTTAQAICTLIIDEVRAIDTVLEESKPVPESDQ